MKQPRQCTFAAKIYYNIPGTDNTFEPPDRFLCGRENSQKYQTVYACKFG